MAVRMKYRSMENVWKIALSVSTYAVTYFISESAKEHIFFFAGWRTFFVPLLLLSCLLSVYLILFKPGIRSMLLIIAVKLVIILLIGYPLGRYVAIEQTLLLIFILEAELYLPGLWGIFSALAGIAIVLSSQGDVLAWGLYISSATRHDLLVMSVHSLLFFILVTITKLSVYRARENRNLSLHYSDMVQEIARANLGFQDHAEEIEFVTRDAERKLITRELHDSIGYTLTSQKMMIEAAILLQTKQPEKLKDLLVKARMQIEEGHADVRSSLRLLRKVEKSPVSYLNRLKHITDNFSQATGVQVKLDTSNLPDRLDPPVSLAIHRLIQEGMTNAFGHGKASLIHISMFDDGERILIAITDNGTGSEYIEEGIGLRGMKERIIPMGGKLSCDNLEPGFKLKAEIPKRGASRDTNSTGR